MLTEAEVIAYRDRFQKAEKGFVAFLDKMGYTLSSAGKREISTTIVGLAGIIGALDLVLNGESEQAKVMLAAFDQMAYFEEISGVT